MAKTMNILSVISLERVDLARINYAMGKARTIIEETFEALSIVGKGGPEVKAFLGDAFNDLTAENLDLIDEMKPGDRMHFVVEKDGKAGKFTLICLSHGTEKFLPEFYCSGVHEA